MPFDLATGPLLRAAIYRLEPDRHVLVATMHHIVSDDWSTGALVMCFAPGLPMKVLRMIGGWRLVEDIDGARGWMLAQFLTRTRTAKRFWPKTLTCATPSSVERFGFSGRQELYTAYLPWAVAFGKLGATGFWSMVVFLAVLTVGFAYEWKKGALEWA